MLFFPLLLASKLLIQDINKAIKNKINTISDEEIFYNIYLVTVSFDDYFRLNVKIEDKYKFQISDNILKEELNYITEFLNEPTQFIDLIKSIIDNQPSINALVCFNLQLEADSMVIQREFFYEVKKKLKETVWNHTILYTDISYYDKFSCEPVVRWCLTHINEDGDISYVHETLYENIRVFILVEMKKATHINQMRKNMEFFNIAELNLGTRLNEYLYEIFYNLFIHRIEIYCRNFYTIRLFTDRITEMKLEICKELKMFLDIGDTSFISMRNLEFEGDNYLTCNHLKNYLYNFCVITDCEIDDSCLKEEMKRKSNFILSGEFELDEIKNNIDHIQMLCSNVWTVYALTQVRSADDFVKYSLFLMTLPEYFINKFYERVLKNSRSPIYRVFIEFLVNTGKIDSAIYSSLVHLNYVGYSNHAQYVVFGRFEDMMKDIIRKINFKRLIFNDKGDIAFFIILFIYRIINEIFLEEINGMCCDEWFQVIKRIGDKYSVAKDENYLFNIIKCFDDLLDSPNNGIFTYLKATHEIMSYFSKINTGHINDEDHFNIYFQEYQAILADGKDYILNYQENIITREQ